MALEQKPRDLRRFSTKVSYLTLSWIITRTSFSWTECAAPINGLSVHMAPVHINVALVWSLSYPSRMIAEVPSGGTETGSECKRAGLWATSHRPMSTIFLLPKAFCSRTLAPEYAAANWGHWRDRSQRESPIGVGHQQGDNWVPPPRFWPRYQRLFHPRQYQQPITEGENKENKPSWSPTAFRISCNFPLG